MPGRKERNCQIRMSSSLWNLVGEIAQELGEKDKRGRHSAVIREMVAAVAAKWTHSPYVCRSARHIVYVTREGNIFSRHLQVLRLNSARLKLPCFIEMKPEKRVYYHEKYRGSDSKSEHDWYLSQWLINHFAVWIGKKDVEELEALQQGLLDADADPIGTTYKSADLSVHAVGGRYLTREIVVGLRDYVQWKEPDGGQPVGSMGGLGRLGGAQVPIFDRFDIPIDIPTFDLEVWVAVDLDLFADMYIDEDEIANLALEFRNRESARFEGKEVALYPEVAIEEQYGRSPDDDGCDDAIRQVRRLKQRVSAILEGKNAASAKARQQADRKAIDTSLRIPERFLFYHLRWPAPHLGIEVCVRWEKPARG